MSAQPCLDASYTLQVVQFLPFHPLKRVNRHSIFPVTSTVLTIYTTGTPSTSAVLVLIRRCTRRPAREYPRVRVIPLMPVIKAGQAETSVLAFGLLEGRPMATAIGRLAYASEGRAQAARVRGHAKQGHPQGVTKRAHGPPSAHEAQTRGSRACVQGTVQGSKP